MGAIRSHQKWKWQLRSIPHSIRAHFRLKKYKAHFLHQKHRKKELRPVIHEYDDKSNDSSYIDFKNIKDEIFARHYKHARRYRCNYRIKYTVNPSYNHGCLSKTLLCI